MESVYVYLNVDQTNWGAKKLDVVDTATDFAFAVIHKHLKQLGDVGVKIHWKDSNTKYTNFTVDCNSSGQK